MRVVTLTGALAALIWCVPAVAEPQTMAEIAGAVEQGNPKIAAQRHVVEALKARVRAARDGYLPSVQATVLGERRTLNVINAKGDETFNVGQADVTVRQPLYDGGRTLQAVRIARAELAAGEAELDRVIGETLLELLSAAADIHGRRAIEGYTRQQYQGIESEIDAIDRRLKLGDATLTDVDQAKARLASSEAALLGASLDVSTSTNRFEAISGTSAEETPELPTLPDMPPSFDEARSIAEHNSPELRSAQESADASGRRVAAARAELMPSISAIAGYEYLKGGVANLFTGKLPNDRSAVYGGVSVTIPIFQQGKEYAEIQRARAVQEQQNSLVEQTQRELARDVVTAWERSRASRRITEAAAKAVAANISTLKGIEREVDLGSRTTTDVLDAQRDLLTARVTAERARISEYVAQAALLAALGQLTAPALGPPRPANEPPAGH